MMMMMMMMMKMVVVITIKYSVFSEWQTTDMFDFWLMAIFPKLYRSSMYGYHNL
jgi:hypothetical protein